ncbi:MAG: IclR family transcriptional regulator [Rhizobiaceae bacterium]
MTVRALSTVQKALEVLNLIGQSREPVRSIDLAKALGESPATVHQRLVTLESSGWIERTEGGRYRLAFKFVGFADSALEQADFGERVQDILQSISAESSEAASLSVLDGTEIVIVRRVESRGPLRADLRVGTRLPVGSSASGKAFLAFGSAKQIEGFRERVTPLEPEELQQIRNDGYATIILHGVRRVAAVAAPVFNAAGSCIATVTVSGPEQGFDFAGSGALTVKGAREISMRFQGTRHGRHELQFA